MLRLFIVGLALSTTTPVWRDRINRIDSRSRLVPQVATSSTPYTFCDTALAAGNRTGNWGCVNGDMTSPAGDHLGWTKTAGATVTTGTTCASPSYLTLANANADRVTSNTFTDSLPGTFTICAAYRQTTNATTSAFMVGTYPCCSAYNITTEQVFGGQMSFYGSGGPSSVYASADENVLACTRVTGGVATAYFRFNGTIAFVPTSAVSYSVIAGQKLTIGSDGASYSLDGQLFGAFYTETALSDDDLDALYTAVYSCP